MVAWGVDDLSFPGIADDAGEIEAAIVFLSVPSVDEPSDEYSSKQPDDWHPHDILTPCGIEIPNTIY